MNKLVLLTGGNMGNRKEVLDNARHAIESLIGKIRSSSPLIQSEAWGFESDQAFLNQVLVIDTSYSAIEVLNKIQEIELSLGRVRKTEQWVSRIIDIDILFFNNELVESTDLTIPHQHIQDRRFTLFALNTILPNYIHPKLGLPISSLLNNCKDQSKVEVYNA